MAIETHEITSRGQWLELRKSYITASVIGALPAFNCHGFATPLRLYAEKRGVEFPDDPDNKVLRRGRWLEAAFPKIVNELRPEWTLTAPNVFLCDPEIGIGATPDYFIDGDPRGLGVVECKTVAPSVYARDWHNGTEIPFFTTLQILTEMMLADAAFGVVAVLLVDPHNMDVAILDVPRHAGAEAKIVAEVKRFWGDIRNGLEPDPNFSRDAEVIKLLTPRESPGKQIDLSGHNELPAMLEERAALMHHIKEADDRRAEIETQIKFLMGDAEIGNGLQDWRITFKTQKRAGYTVPPKEPRVLLIKDKRPQAEAS